MSSSVISVAQTLSMQYQCDCSKLIDSQFGLRQLFAVTLAVGMQSIAGDADSDTADAQRRLEPVGRHPPVATTRPSATTFPPSGKSASSTTAPATGTPQGAKNIKWVARLGSQTYGNPVVADGKVFVGTNNSGGWLKRYPADVDLGVPAGFDVKDGKFLWQHSSEKLPTGRVHDWPHAGHLQRAARRRRPAVVRHQPRRSPLRRHRRLSRRRERRRRTREEARSGRSQTRQTRPTSSGCFDMMKELGISQHNMASCSLTSAGDLLFVCTSNGVDVEHNYIPRADAASFFAMDKNTQEGAVDRQLARR